MWGRGDVGMWTRPVQTQLLKKDNNLEGKFVAWCPWKATS
jgi:hypothetical protein